MEKIELSPEQIKGLEGFRKDRDRLVQALGIAVLQLRSFETECERSVQASVRSEQAAMVSIVTAAGFDPSEGDWSVVDGCLVRKE